MINNLAEIGYNILMDSSISSRRLSKEDQLEKLVFSRLLQPMMETTVKTLGDNADSASTLSGSKMNSGMMFQHVIENMAIEMALNHDLGLMTSPSDKIASDKIPNDKITEIISDNESSDYNIPIIERASEQLRTSLILSKATNYN